MDDAINESMLEQEFAGLEVVRKFEPDSVGDGASSGKANHSSRFREGDVALQSPTGRYSSHGRVGEDAEVEPAGGVVAGDGCGNLGHLHKREDAFLHAGSAAGATDENEGQAQFRGAFRGSGQFLAYHTPHASSHEGEIGYSQHDGSAADESFARDRGIPHTGLLLFFRKSLIVGDAVHETQRIARAQVGIPFFKRAFVQQLSDAVASWHGEMVVAFRADIPAVDNLLAEDGSPALGAAHPQPLRNAALDPLACHALAPHCHNLFHLNPWDRFRQGGFLPFLSCRLRFRGRQSELG